MVCSIIETVFEEFKKVNEEPKGSDQTTEFIFICYDMKNSEKKKCCLKNIFIGYNRSGIWTLRHG